MTNIYIFDFGNRIKIGRTGDVQKRLKAIENSSGERAKNVFFLEVNSDVEKLAHHYFEKYRTVGEYFSCPFDKAKEVLNYISTVPEKFKKAKRIIRPQKPSISNKIKGLMSSKGKKSYELAEYFKISTPAMRNKMARNSFSAEDLIKVADFLGFDLAFISDTQKTVLDLSDIDIKAGE